VKRRKDRRAAAGFTLLEATISSALLAIAILTALVISQAATKASNRAVLAAAREAEVVRHLDALRRLVGRVALSTLRAVPAADPSQTGGSPPAAEPMLDGIAYDNLSFREPVGFVDGDTLYDPPLADSPRRIALVREDGRAAGSLLVTDDAHEFELARDVGAVSFVRRGNQLEVTLTLAHESDGGESTRQIHVALHAR